MVTFIISLSILFGAVSSGLDFDPPVWEEKRTLIEENG